MRIIVTGGAGFLGSHICTRLLDDGHEVICVDNLSTGFRENIAHLNGRDGFSFIEHDISLPLAIEGEIDQIYNLACPASPPKYQALSVETLDVCYLGMKNMLILAKEKGARVMQASTSEVYGDPLVHPQTEDYHGNVNSYGVRSCYDEGKRVAEALCFEYQRVHGVDTRIVRIFNTYGPRMDIEDGRVVTNFVMQALKGIDITIYGDGSQTRSFCYVDDEVEGIIRLMNVAENHGPTNVGNPNEFTIKELAEKVIEQTGSTSNIIYEPLPGDDPTRRQPDITKAKNVLDWEPRIQLDEGLMHIIADFRERLNP